MRSAASRGFSAIHSRSVTSASSAAYSVALSSGTCAKVLSDFLAPGACSSTCVERNAGVPEMALGKRRPCRAARARRRARRRCSMVSSSGADADAVRRSTQAVVLEVLPDLEDRGVFEQRLRARRSASRSAPASSARCAEVEAAAGRAMPERHVAGLARRDAPWRSRRTRPAWGRGWSSPCRRRSGRRRAPPRSRLRAAAASVTVSYLLRSIGLSRYASRSSQQRRRPRRRRRPARDCRRRRGSVLSGLTRLRR